MGRVWCTVGETTWCTAWVKGGREGHVVGKAEERPLSAREEVGRGGEGRQAWAMAG